MARAARIIGFVIFVVLLIWGLIRLWPIIMPLFLALLFAYILQPAVKAIASLDVPLSAAIIVVYLYVIIIIVSLFGLCLPILFSQFSHLLQLLPDLLRQVNAAFDHIFEKAGIFALTDFADGLAEYADGLLADKAQSVLADSASALETVIRSALYAVLTPFLAYYILRDNGDVRRKIVNWLPIGERSELCRVGGDIDHLLRQYVVGYLLVSLIVAGISAAFYWCIGLDSSLALGLIMGVADLIPYFGPFLGAIPAIIIALSIDTEKAILTAAGLLVIQQLESVVITPKVMGDKVGLHPLTTIMAVLVGGWQFGILGTILAVPVAAAGLLALRYLWSRIVGAKIT